MIFKKFKYSVDKNIINAIVTGQRNFKLKDERYQRIFKIIQNLYALWILIVIATSVSMLVFDEDFMKSNVGLFTTLETIVLITLITDLILRWYTSEIRLKKGNLSYLIYPFTISGAILIISLLPSLYLIGIWGNFPFMTGFQNLKFLRIFRILLLASLTPGLGLFGKVLKKEAKTLYVIFVAVVVVILIFALVIYNTERGIDVNGLSKGDKGFDVDSVQFKTFWDAIYYATITLTTIGFGDRTPHTVFGQAITVVMSVIGIAILAIPSGVIAGGFISELKNKNNK